MANDQTARERGGPLRQAIDLTDRQRSVLRAVVEDYVFTAVPVGSRRCSVATRWASRPPRSATRWPTSRRWAC